MNWLRSITIPLWEKELASYVQDPWAARNDYISVVLDRSKRSVEDYFSRNVIPSLKLNPEDRIKILKLQELQRHAMLMYTSCGWFFDDISGIETVQVISYAGRVIQLAKELWGTDLEPEYIARLEKAPSNLRAFETGARIYDRFVKPAPLNLLKIGVHYAVSSLFENYPETIHIGEYEVQNKGFESMESVPQKLTMGKARIQSITTWEEDFLDYVVLYLGDQSLIAGAVPSGDERSFSQMRSDIKDAFQRTDVPRIKRLMIRYFGNHNYSLWDLLRDKKREVLSRLLSTTLEEAEASIRKVFENHYSVMDALKKNNIPIPQVFATSVQFILNADFRKFMETKELKLENLKKIIDEFKKWGLQPEGTSLAHVSSTRLNQIMEDLLSDPENTALLKTLDGLLTLLKDLSLDLNLWKTQNLYFELCRQQKDFMEEKEKEGDPRAEEWMLWMKNIGHLIGVNCF